MTLTEPKLLKAETIAARWSVSRREIYRLVERGDLPSIVIGERSVRVPLAAVENYEKERLRG